MPAFQENSTDEQKVGQFIDWVLRNRLELIQDGIASYPRLRTGQYLVNCRVNESQGGPLHIACRYNFARVVEFLLKQPHVDVNLRTRLDETPLHVAAQFNHVACIDLLLKSRQTDRAALNKSGRTALHDAVFDNRTPAVAALAQEVPDIMWKGSFALHTAVSRGYAGVLQALSDAKYPMEKLNSTGLTCLHLAVTLKQTECVHVLTETLHMDPTKPTSPTKSSQQALTLLALARKSGNAGLLKMIQDYCAKWSLWQSQLNEPSQKPAVCKLYLLGNELVGKSALLDSMKRSRLEQLVHQRQFTDDEAERTSGVNIVELFQTFSCWDFAGQIDDYVTHDFFLVSSNIIFLVLISLTDTLDKQRSQLMQWLRVIKTCYRGAVDLDGRRRSTSNAASLALLSIVRAPVVIVHTHRDMISDYEFGQRVRALKNMAAEVRQLFHDFLHIDEEVIMMDATDCGTPEMTLLKKTLNHCRDNLLRDQPPARKICDDIAVALAGKRDCYSGAKSVMSFRQYSQFVHDNVNPLISVDDLRTVTISLSATSTLFFHKDMQDTVVLDPRWLCGDLLGVLLSPQKFEKTLIRADPHGIIQKADLYEAFPDLQPKKLDTLMEFFQLCIPVEDNDQCMLLPSLIVDNRMPDERVPSDIWQETEPGEMVAIGRRFVCVTDLDIFSPGFFPRLQVRAWKIHKPGSKWRLWKGGMYMCSPVGERQEMKQELLMQIWDARQIDIIVRVPAENAKILTEQLGFVHMCMENAIRAFSSSIRLQLLALSGHDLCRKHAGGTYRYAYPIKEVCLAERGNRMMLHASAGEEDPVQLLHAGIKSHSFAAKQSSAHVMYLDEQCLEELNDALNKHDMDTGSWRNLAQVLDLGDMIEIFAVQPSQATLRLMERYTISPRASIRDFRRMLSTKVGNVAATSAVTRCITRMCPSS